jgi:uncharacterized protein YecE (DUF72 family)
LRNVQSWRRMVPPDFEFAVRGNKALTHKYKFQPVPEAFAIFKRMTTICNALEAEILHLQTPPNFEPTKTNIEIIDNFFSSTGLKGIRVALEIRAAGGPLTPYLVKVMKDHNMIHCIDLSKDEEPAFKSDILYSRLFGKGSHNIYQPTDHELRQIDSKASRGDNKKIALSFHFVRMYKDAARFKIYKQTGEFPMVTKSTGVDSLAEVLREDAEFPSVKEELIRRQGWKLIDLKKDTRVHASYLLEMLPEKTYTSISDIIRQLESL